MYEANFIDRSVGVYFSAHPVYVGPTVHHADARRAMLMTGSKRTD